MDANRFIVRIARGEELVEAGRISRAAYEVDGLLKGANGYAELLEAAPARAANAGVEVLVAVAEQPTGSEKVAGTITVAEAGSALADIALPGEVELRMLGVDHEFRKQGVGEMLMWRGIEWAHDRGFAAVWSLVHDNERAARLYERMGVQRLPHRDWEVEDLPELGAMLVYCVPPTLSRAG